MIDKIKNLASDTMIYGIFMVVGKFLTFLLTPMYTWYLVQDEVGEYIYIYSIIAFLNMIYTFGMEASFFRFYSHDDLNKSRKVFSHAYLTIAAIGGSISAILFFSADSIAPAITNLKDGPELVRYASLIPFLDTLIVVPYALLRMTRRAKRFAYTRFVLIVIAVGFNILFVAVFKMGVKGIFLANIISAAVGVLLFSKDIISNLTISISPELLRKMFRFGIPTIPASLSAIALHVADKQILKVMTNAENVALYGVNYKLGIPMMIFVAVFEYAWKPFYLSNYKEADAKKTYSRVLTYFTMFSACIFLITGLLIESIVQITVSGKSIIPSQYWSGLGIIPIILGGYFFNGVFTNFAAGFYIEKKTKYLPVAVGIAAIVNIGMNVTLIPVIGIWGSAWATIGAYAIGALVLYVFTRKVYPLKYEWKRLLQIFFTTLLVYFGAMYLSEGYDSATALLIRIPAIALLFLILWQLKFFTPKEIEGVKNLFSKVKTGINGNNLKE